MITNYERLFIDLLKSSERRKVDYKRDQYLLDNDVLKSEFVKDIVSMANAPEEDGYILIGVKAERGKPRELIGITKHHDGSDLEQIVNGVIEQPIQFEYLPLVYKGRTYALIHVPFSKAKPHWPKKDYGILKRHIFYTRRGSGNREASVQEIREMFVSTMHITDIARRNVTLSNVVDELSELTVDEREIKMHNILRSIAPRIGLTRYRSLGSFLSRRHWCSLVSMIGDTTYLDFAVFMYPWTANAHDIRASRRNLETEISGSQGKKVRRSTIARLNHSTPIHVSYKGISTKSLEEKAFSSSGGWFANEQKYDWGKVMVWEDTVVNYVDGKPVYREEKRNEYFLQNVTSRYDMQERLTKLLNWAKQHANNENLS
jgi:hypothetical protein